MSFAVKSIVCYFAIRSVPRNNYRNYSKLQQFGNENFFLYPCTPRIVQFLHGT